MRGNVAGFAGPLSIEQFKGGQSNPTYKLMTPNACYVLRRKPSGPLVGNAHDVEREARVLQALGQAEFPVPAVYAVCTDEAINRLEVLHHGNGGGAIFWDATFPQVGYTQRPAYFDAMNDTIARLHLLQYSAFGLGDYGKPGNYFARQIGRWSKQYLQDADAGRDPNMDALIEWLPANIPADDQASLIHGDFRCDT